MSEPAREFVPDPRDNPDWWTVRRVVEEVRPKASADGSGGRRKLWAVCVAPGCGVQKTLPVELMDRSGFSQKQIVDLPLRCGCGAMGHAKLTWVNPPRVRDRGGAFPAPGKPRPGNFDFSTGKRTGGWD